MGNTFTKRPPAGGPLEHVFRVRGAALTPFYWAGLGVCAVAIFTPLSPEA